MSSYERIFYFYDIINSITEQYLCYADVQALSLACPRIRNFIDKKYYDINEIISIKLSKEIGKKNTSNLLENLKKYNTYLSGRFLLKCIYNIKYDFNDIIVLSTDAIKLGITVDLINPFYATGYISYDDMIDTDELLKLKHEPSPVPLFRETLLGYKRFPRCKVKIIDIMIPSLIYGRKQSNLMNYKTCLGFIEQVYDIEIEKIIYDGNRLKIKDINKIFKRSFVCNTNKLDYIKELTNNKRIDK